MNELNRLIDERNAVLAAAQAIPAPADANVLSAHEYAMEVQREALLTAYTQRSELIATLLDES